MLRIQHCLDNRLTDGGKIVSPTHRQRSAPQKHYFSASDTLFCLRLSKPQGLERNISPGAKLPGRDPDHSTATSAQIIITRIYASTPPYVFMAYCLIKQMGNFTCIFFPQVEFINFGNTVGELFGSPVVPTDLYERKTSHSIFLPTVTSYNIVISFQQIIIHIHIVIQEIEGNIRT
jgi:hypothetical protein